MMDKKKKGGTTILLPVLVACCLRFAISLHTMDLSTCNILAISD
jgi:hypothetical protein